MADPKDKYIDIGRASISSLVERADTSIALNSFVNINLVAKLKGYTTNRPVRQEINKENSKYTARKVKVQGGFSYEILFSTLEPEIQEKILDEEIKSKSLVPINNNIEPVYEFKTEKLRSKIFTVLSLLPVIILPSFNCFIQFIALLCNLICFP